MKFSLDIGEIEEDELVSAIVGAMAERGLVVPAEGRTKPFSLPEMIEETGLSDSQVRNMIKSGVFEKVPHVGRALVTVRSVRKWQGFNKGRKG